MPSTHHLTEAACTLIVGLIIAPVHRSLSFCDNGLHGRAAERLPASVGHSADPRASPAITHGPRCIAWYMSGNPSRIPVFLRDPDPRRQRGRDHSTSGGTTTGNSRPLQCPNGRELPRTGGSHIRAMDYFSRSRRRDTGCEFQSPVSVFTKGILMRRFGRFARGGVVPSYLPPSCRLSWPRRQDPPLPESPLRRRGTGDLGDHPVLIRRDVTR